VHFLQILPSAKRNWQEKTSERAFSPAPESTIKPEAAPVTRKPSRGKEKQSLKIQQMKTLEELLQELGCEGNAFDSTGEFTKAGEKAYDRLEHLLYDIERLTGKEVTPIIRELDKICNENY
jgi:hypothetical protein